MNRLKEFRRLREHEWLGKQFKKLTTDDVQIAESFIRYNEALTKGAFQYKLNSMFLDMAVKPKNHSAIIELLSCANSKAD